MFLNAGFSRPSSKGLVVGFALCLLYQVKGEIEGVKIILLPRGALKSDGLGALVVLHFQALEGGGIALLVRGHVLVKGTRVVGVIRCALARVEFALK